MAQPEKGYRAAIDPVFLAASVTAGGDETILDAGCGAGAAALCLAARMPDCRITGIERDPAAAALARKNVILNGMEDRIVIVEGCFRDYAKANSGIFDQVISNPPFHSEGRHTKSPQPGKAAAHGEGDIDLTDWIKAAAAALKSGGKLTLIHRADRLGEILKAFGNRFGAAVIFPLWPNEGGESKRILVSAVKGRRTLPRLMPGLALHLADGKFTPGAEAILRDARHLDFTGGSA